MSVVQVVAISLVVCSLAWKRLGSRNTEVVSAVMALVVWSSSSAGAVEDFASQGLAGSRRDCRG